MNKYNKYKEEEKRKGKKQIMHKLPHVTHSQHERTVDIIRCQTERIWP